MQILYPSDIKTRNTVVAAISANKIVAWLFADNLLIYQGTTQKAFSQGRTAVRQPLITCDFVVQGGTTGFAVTANVNSTDFDDDFQAARQVASLS